MSSTPPTAISTLSVNTIRGLAIDGVQAANSGHPGLPLGAALMAYALWKRHLKHNPKNPHWFDRDRFVLSAGHGSMLLYSLLHLAGYDLPLDELKRFRQLGSKTPGHPENGLTPGVEMATGPLGQGISTAVGYAIAERFLAATYSSEIVDHYTYVICSDGDLMEGISNEAASLAGHLGLGRLIVLYDDNGITIDGTTAVSFTEDVAARFEALGWHTERLDGMDVDAVDAAISRAKLVEDRPSLLLCKTVIGFGSPHKAGTSKVHGSPLGPEELELTKQALGIPSEPKFFVPAEATVDLDATEAGRQAEAEWQQRWDAYAAAEPAKAEQFLKSLSRDWGQDWLDALPSSDAKVATRKSGEAVLQAVAAHIPTLLGGSADLAESNFTHLHGQSGFQKDNHSGRNVNYGVREHAMAAAVNGMTLHGGVLPIGATFLIFSDYCRPSLRLAALMEVPSLFVFTHDSIGVGEDGPTHQPVEHLTALRAIPNFNVFRPADANEAAVGYKVAIESKHTPTALILSRQALPALSPSDVRNHPAERGAYVLREASGPVQVILIGSGSEVSLCVDAQAELEASGVATRVVSIPSWLLFDRQGLDYRREILPLGVPAVSVEAGSTLAWGRYAQAHVGIDTFGTSAPADQAFRHFGFTVEHVVSTARTLLG